MAALVEQVFEVGGRAREKSLWEWVRSKLAIRVVDHRYSPQWPASPFWKSAEEAGVSIAFVHRAVTMMNNTLHPTTGRPWIPESEARFRFAPAFWHRAGKWEPSGIACALSHCRGLEEAGEAIGPRGWALMIERDMQPSENAFLQVLWIMKNLMTNVAFKSVHYVNLVFSGDRSDHLVPVAQILLNQPVWSGPANFHFELLPCPLETKGSRSQFRTLRNIGAGARMYMVRHDFLEELSSKLVWSWWDVHLLSEAANFRSEDAAPGDLTCVFSFPAVAKHPVNRGCMTRGSERVASLLVAEASYADFITLSLDREWGVSNRWSTVVSLLTFCNSRGIGLHVYWSMNDACWAQSYDLFVLEPKNEHLPGLAFVQIHHDPVKFGALCRPTVTRNLGNFRFQCTTNQFLRTMKECLRRQPENKSPVWNAATTIQVFDAAWKATKVRAQHIAEVDYFLAGWGPQQRHASIHVRRGDLKATLLEDAKKKPGVQFRKMLGLMEDADEQVKELCRRFSFL